MLSFHHVAIRSSKETTSVQAQLEAVSIGEKKVSRKRGESLEFQCYKVSFGELSVAEGLSVPLVGEIRCPFKFINRANQEQLSIANQDLWAWAVRQGFTKNSQKNKEAFDKYNLVQFAAYTVVNVPKLEVDLIGRMRSGVSVSELVSSILETSESLEASQLLRQSKYLLWLFRHDNWVEEQTNINVIREVHTRCYDALNTLNGSPFVKEDYFQLHPEGTLEDLSFINTLILSMGNIGYDFNLAFHTRHFAKGQQYLGYDDFCQTVNRYFESQVAEALYRSMDEPIEPELYRQMSRRLRQEACGVYTVNYSALAECQVPISKESQELSPRILRISELFSALICHFNDLISAPREINKSNWKNNDLALLTEEQSSISPTISKEANYTLAVSRLFQKINADLQGAFLEIEAITERDFASNPDQIRSVLTYLAIIQEWAIGSMPAQMALDRYSKHRAEGPYIKKGECLDGDSNFWRFASVD